MAAHLIAIRRPAMHAGDLLTHPPPQLLDQAAPRRIRRQRHQLDGQADISSPAHGPSTGGGRPLARTGQRPAGRVRRTRHQDIRMHMDRPMIQHYRDALSLRRGSAPVREERRQRRPAHRRRPPGDHLARHDLQTAHAAQVTIGRPTPFRPHRIGARPSIPVGQGRAPGDRDVIPIHGHHLVGVRAGIRHHVRTRLQVGLLVRIRAMPMPAGALPGEAQPIQDAGDPAQRGVASPPQLAADGVQGPARLGQPARPRVTADQMLHLRSRRLRVMAVRGNKRACARVRPGWGGARCPRRPSDSASERRLPDGADAARVRAP